MHQFYQRPVGNSKPFLIECALNSCSHCDERIPNQFSCISGRLLRASGPFVKIHLLLGLLVALIVTGCYPQGSMPQGVRVYFSPRGGATEAVVQALQQATNTILVQAYSFTSPPIARALVDAHNRGVAVRVVLDKSQRTEKYSEADFLIHEGIATLMDSQHAIAHNKIMVLDSYLILTGSFNFTKAAEENNAKNLLIINDPVLAKHYISNWLIHEAHSELFERAEQGHTRPAGHRRE
jgi:phosphatidylserine/phosphatidylglycerophosphate/cardiolipin synthase-like enzyme